MGPGNWRWGLVWGEGLLEEDTGLRGIGLTRPEREQAVWNCAWGTPAKANWKQPRDKSGRQSSNTPMPLPSLLLVISLEFLIAQTFLRLMNPLTPSFVFICIIFSPVLFQENYWDRDNEWETRGKPGTSSWAAADLTSSPPARHCHESWGKCPSPTDGSWSLGAAEHAVCIYGGYRILLLADCLLGPGWVTVP